MEPIKCSVLHNNYGIRLTDGGVSHCCRFKTIPLNTSELQQLEHRYFDFNSQTAQARQDLANGIQTPRCNGCWDFENRNQISWRTQHHSERDDIVSLNVLFSSLCNQSCFYCGPDDSSTISSYGKWINDFTGEVKNTSKLNVSSESAIKFDYVLNFVKQLPDHVKTLNIGIVGGEPLLLENFSDNISQLVEAFTFKEGRRASIGFSTNTNTKPEKTLEFYENLKRKESTRNVETVIVSSIENIEERAEYVRDGLVWSNFVENFKIHNANAHQHSIRLTLNPFSVVNIADFVKYFSNYKTKFLYNYPWQKHFQIRVLDERFKSECAKLENYVADRMIGNMFEQRFFVALKTHIENDRQNAKIFKRAITNLDELKNKNWRPIFPEYVDWFDSIE